MSNKLVIYHHGKDSIPWGEKPLAVLPDRVQAIERFLD
jgi:hypothetical protein